MRCARLMASTHMCCVYMYMQLARTKETRLSWAAQKKIVAKKYLLLYWYKWMVKRHRVRLLNFYAHIRISFSMCAINRLMYMRRGWKMMSSISRVRVVRALYNHMWSSLFLYTHLYPFYIVPYILAYIDKQDHYCSRRLIFIHLRTCMWIYGARNFVRPDLYSCCISI